MNLFEELTYRGLINDISSDELAEKLNVTKSCLNHRLRKLVSIANEL